MNPVEAEGGATEYAHEDGEPVNQPIGYWTWAADKTLSP
ncbi:hypothetical protein FHS37_006474 [Streptomyces griseostramineus]|uniref:Uncharacterized protein n=1 Tax=Streptomyces griseomycini TaxID=66895 RepID=A0A7W7PW46_9ACTN|nr:hypothetical protein [Streptomyces griseomycini]